MNTRRQLVAGIAAAIVEPRGARVQAFPARPARFGVCGPKGMEPALARTLHDAFRKTLAEKATIERLGLAAKG